MCRLTCQVWILVLRQPWMLFTIHPIANSAAAMMLFNALLLLQPTHTADQKRKGAVLHGILSALALVLALAGTAAIIANKSLHNGKCID